MAATPFFGGIDLSNEKAINVGTPTSGGDAVNKTYADGLLIPVTSGVFTVRVSTTANVTISTALVGGQVLDGVTLVTGDRVLVPFQTTGSQNGIYTVSASPARATDADTGAEFPPGSQVYVQEGTAYGKTIFRNTNNGTSVTIGTTALTFATGAAWISVTGGVGYQNSWVDFGSTYQIGQYRRNASGDVDIRGLVKSGGVGATIFTLPSGYRPLKDEVFAIDSSAGLGGHGRCDVNSAGQVIPQSGTNTYFSLGGISFSTL